MENEFKPYAKHVKEQLNTVKRFVREHYAWPGGYELVAITNDGELLCHECVKQNIRSVFWDIFNRCDTGWQITSIGMEAVSADACDDEYKSYCAHCAREFGELG